MPRRNADLLDLLLNVLLLIYKQPGINRSVLSERLMVSEQVIGRQVKILRNKFKVEIKSSPKCCYELIHWGIFDSREFLNSIDSS